MDIVERLRKRIDPDDPDLWVLDRDRIEAANEIERLRSQLPDSMRHCTILFKECENGHGRLTATNWIDHGCEQCEIEHLRSQLVAFAGIMHRFKEPNETGN